MVWNINPKIVLCTLQKEQSLIAQKTPLLDSDPRMQKAMGVALSVAKGFHDQVNSGCQVFSKWFSAPITFFPVAIKQKFDRNGALVRGYNDQNHIYVVPSGPDNDFVAVGFMCANHSTFTQHKFTNYLTHRTDLEAGHGVKLPTGGVYSFISIWKRYFGS